MILHRDDDDDDDYNIVSSLYIMINVNSVTYGIHVSKVQCQIYCFLTFTAYNETQVK